MEPSQCISIHVLIQHPVDVSHPNVLFSELICLSIPIYSQTNDNIFSDHIC